MFKIRDFIAYTIFATILFPVAFNFVGTDAAIYLKAGETIFSGEKIYVDFVDIKTPLFFAAYSLISFIINNTPNYLFILIFFIFLFTAIFLYHFIKNEFNYKIGISTAIIFSLSTLIVGNTLYYHSELIFGFLLLLIIFVYARNFSFEEHQYYTKGIINNLFFGILLGLFISIKYTFAIILIPFLIIDFFYEGFHFKTSLKKNIIIYSALFITLLFSHFLLLDPQIYEGYKNTLSLMSAYANLPQISIKLLRDIVKVTGQFFGDNISLLFTISAFLGIINVFKDNWTSKQKLIVISSFLLVGALLLSVFIERKLIIYHFARFIVPFSIISGIGTVLFVEKIFELWKIKKNKRINQTIIVCIVIFLLFIGPLSRYIGILRFTYYAVQGKEEYYEFIDQQRPNFANLIEKMKLTDYINRNYDSSYSTFIVSIGSFDLIYELNTKVIKKLPQRNSFLPKQLNTPYYQDFIHFLKTADLLIIQKNDITYENITGNTKSSLELVNEDNLANQIINQNFEVKYESKVYRLYSKKNRNTFSN